MLRRRALAPIMLLGALGLSCARPDAASRVRAFVGRNIEAFMKDGDLRPKAVLQEAGGRTYVFEVLEIGEESIPPSDPVQPRNLENAVPPVQLRPGAGNPYGNETPRVAPGTPKDAPIGRATRVRTWILRVGTDAGGTIRTFARSEK